MITWKAFYTESMSTGPELTVAAIQNENSRKRKGKEKQRGIFQVFVLSFT